MTTSALPLELRHVSKWFGTVRGLIDVSLTCEGIVALVGPSGAGKSTLLGVAAGVIAPSAGEALIFGQPVARQVEARRQLGYCPEVEWGQGWLSARQMVAFMGELSGMDARETGVAAFQVLQVLGMSESDMDRPLHGLSRGLRQRAKVAQAIVHSPRVVILDDPLAGCDLATRRRLLTEIRRLGDEGRTVLLSTHFVDEVTTVADSIVTMRAGRARRTGGSADPSGAGDLHQVTLRCQRPAMLGARILAAGVSLQSLSFEGARIRVETSDLLALYGLLDTLVGDEELAIDEVDAA
jgi:ABC-2 type transport system ATP-binding protein